MYSKHNVARDAPDTSDSTHAILDLGVTHRQ